MSHQDSYDRLGLGKGSGAPLPRLRIASPLLGTEEEEAVAAVLRSGILTNGPATAKFESTMAELHETEHGVAFANGTVALAAMYLAAGIGPGDEVIVPSLTFISTATSVLHVGATPVFADVQAETLNLDPDDVARRITPRTKAIVAVHYGGQAADLDRFRDLADHAGIALLEDAAQAHGARFGDKPVGGWGDSSMFSFTPTKNVTTGEGSVVTTNDGDIARKLRLLRNHGMDAPYHHAQLGWNWRLSDVLAAIGTCQLERLAGIITGKQQTARALGERLDRIDGVTPPLEAAGRTHPFMLYTVRVAGGRRDQVSEALTAAGIENRIYFPAAHRQPVFRDRTASDLPVTDRVTSEILSLPVHREVTPEDLDEMAAVIRAVLTSATMRSG